jgi:hypothetical protein
VADDPNLYGYCHGNPVNFIDPTGHTGVASAGAAARPNNFKIGFQQGWGLVGASLNAAAMLSGDSNLSALSSAISLFVVVYDKYFKPRQIETDTTAAKADQPIEGPTERAKAKNGGTASTSGDSDWIDESGNPIEGSSDIVKVSHSSNEESGGLFKESDFGLNPEVQEAISYYDDMDLYADTAYRNGIINEQEYRALKSRCQIEVTKLRQSNEIKSGYGIGELIFDTLLAFVPGGEILSYTSTAEAATHDMFAIRKINHNAGYLSKIVSASAKYTVYELYDAATGQVKYVGRTRQTLRARQLQHWRADKLKNGLQIRAAKLEGKTLTGLSYGQSRGLEHYVYKNYVDDGVKLLNKIKPLNLKSTGARVLRVQQYMDDALRFLGRIIL